MPSYRGKVAERWVRETATGEPLLCCWADCERYGVELHKAREFLGFNPQTGGPVYTWYVFCSERHKMFWVHSPRDLYRLPPGYRLAVI